MTADVRFDFAFDFAFGFYFVFDFEDSSRRGANLEIFTRVCGF